MSSGTHALAVTSLASFLLLWDNGYEPRHRVSKRESGTGELARREPTGLAGAEPEYGGRLEPEYGGRPASEFPGRLDSEGLRRVLEACPLDELTRIIPDVVRVVVHSSGNTMTTAWNEFRDATRNDPQEDAVVIRLGRANEALWLITNGPFSSGPFDHAVGAG
jgi:hypothetical protein